MLKLCKIHACPNGTLGLHLSRAPWDPYPWVSGVQNGSNAYQAGVRSGDTVLELNGCDVLGQKISELAGRIQNHWQRGGSFVTVLVWRNKTDNGSINQQSLQKFAKCLQQIAQLLECPICLEVVKPPGWQCCNGHVLCNSCRGRTVKCPICRVTLGPRGRCLLSDKLFTLLAESFPCDGVRNGNRAADCSPDYTGCHDSPPSSPPPSHLINTNIRSTSATSSASPSPSSSPSLDKVYLQNHQITINNNDNNSKQLKKPDEDTNQPRSAYSRRSKDDSNIVVLKLNPKSKRKSDTVDHTSCHHRQHHHHHHHHHHHRSHHSFQDNQAYNGRLGQQQTSFHCPTGKSSCSILSHNPPVVIEDASNNNSRPDPDTKMLNCSWTQDVSHKTKGEEKIETLARFITEWDILFHLTQVHQISVVQHYTAFDQVVRVQFLNSKSMNCISIQVELGAPHPNKENFKNNVNASDGGGAPLSTMVPGNDVRYKNSRITNVQNTKMELFFVVCMPVVEEELETDFDWSEADLRDGVNDVDRHTRRHVPRRQSEFDGCRDVSSAFSTASPTDTDNCRPTLGLGTGTTKIATKSKAAGDSEQGEAIGHMIQDAEFSPFHATETSTLQSRVDGERRSPASCRSTCTYRLKVQPDSPTWGTTSSSSSSCSSSSSPSSRSSTSSCSSSVCSSTSYPSSLASLTMSSCTSYRQCTNANMDTNSPATRHAIFIWHFGNECDAKNYQTVIECKRTGLRWTGCIHSLTESWPSIQQRHRQVFQLQQQQQQQDIAEQFLVLDSMPDGDVENFFDIAIKIK